MTQFRPLRNIVPRSRQHQSQIVPGRQKLRHASLSTALEKTVIKTMNPADGTPVDSAPKTNFIAGPL